MTQLDFMRLDLVCPELPVAVLTNDRYSDPLRKSVCHPNWHPQWELHYLIEGELELVLDHTTHFLNPGDVAIIHSNQLHQSFAPNRVHASKERIFHPKQVTLRGIVSPYYE